MSNGIFLQSTSLTKIYFEGTLEQWNTLTNDVESLGLRNEITVICSDGEITLDADYGDALPGGEDIGGGGISGGEGLTLA